MGGTRPFKVLTEQEKRAADEAPTSNGQPPPRSRTFPGRSPTPGMLPPDFTLADQLFVCVHELPAKAAALIGVYWTPRLALEFLEAVLAEDDPAEGEEFQINSVTRLHATLDRKDVIFKIEDLYDICNWLTEVYTSQTPTQEPAGSPAGSSQDGTTSTESLPATGEAASTT